MLDFLRSKASERKARLLAVACCRRLDDLKGREKSLKALSIAERYADGMVDRKELLDARSRAWGAAASFNEIQARRRAIPTPADARTHAALVAAARTTNPWHASFFDMAFPTLSNDAMNRNPEFVAFIRDIFGTPMRPAPAIDATVLNWNGGTVCQLAMSIYDDRGFDRLPLLADSLEDAGCSDVEILGHLRSPGPHVRGCWAVDLLTGKK
jgi:hypothetical protein